MTDDVGKPYVYVPDGAKTNKGEISDEPPKTEYEDRRGSFDRELLKDLTKGHPSNHDRYSR